MVTHNIPTPLNPNAVPTMNDPDEMGPWSSTLYGILDTINNPGPVIEPAYNYVNETLGNIIDLDPQTVLDAGVNTAYNIIGLGPFGTLQDVMDTTVESMDLDDPEYGISIPGEGQGVFGETSSVSPGMGMGGGPDAANMSLDDFGIADPLGLDNALSWNNRVSPKVLNVDPSIETLMDWNPGLFQPNLEFRTFDKFDPETLQEQFFNNPQKMWDNVEESFNMSEVNPVMDSDLSGVEGFMEAGGVLGGGSGVIGPDFDMGAVSQKGGGELQEALAQRVAENIIAQQAARQVTPESNKVTIPTSSGPDIVIDVTPPKPQKVAPQRRAAPKPSPVKIAAKSVAKPKAFKKLPKFAQKEIRQGKVPTGGSDYVQDMVKDFLGGQKAFGDSGTRK